MLTPPAARRRSGAPLVVALVLVVAAAGFLTWSLIHLGGSGADQDSARQAANTANARLADLRNGDIEVKTARDQALDAGRKGVVVLNTVDYQKVDASLDEWERVSTGDLHDQLVSSRKQSKQAIVTARSVTKPAVLTAAVQAVDAKAGTATVLVALKVSVSVGDAAPTDKFLRLTCTLLRTDQGWQLNSIGQVPYQS